MLQLVRQGSEGANTMAGEAAPEVATTVEEDDMLLLSSIMAAALHFRL